MMALTANTLWMWACRRSLILLRQSLGRVPETQWQVLDATIRANSQSQFGVQHDFAGIRCVDDFRQHVPLADYEAFAPWVDRIAAGESGLLTSEPVKLLEPTSGSVSGRKLIPYTDTLQQQFRSGIDPWIADLLSTRPALRRGRSYWMVSPPLESETTSGGLPVGLADDTQYLGPISRLLARQSLAVPSGMMDNVAAEDAPYRTLLQLLTVPDLTLMSIWSPTFLTTLLRSLWTCPNQLIDDLQQTGHRPAATRVSRILASACGRPKQLKQLWPRLGLISCWTDASAAHGIQAVRELFPDVELQPKGLISTEAFVSLPLIGRTGGLLSVRSHFFEFQCVDAVDDDTLLAVELTVGQRYRVIVTTGGGLYRYRTHDVVEVVSYEQQCPQLRFCGRDNRTSDLVGEKLSELFVASAIERMLKQLNLQPTFAMLVPKHNPPGYELLLDLTVNRVRTLPVPAEISKVLENFLVENPYYQHARRSEQLAAVQVAIGRADGSRWAEFCEMHSLEQGMRRGDIKPGALGTAL